MQKNNKWVRGPVELVIPPLPTWLRGALGCRFDKATFDPKVGIEVYLTILEVPEYAHAYAKTRPFNLLSTQGFVRTGNGIVAFIVWTVAAGSACESVVDHFLNPHVAETIALVSSAGQQSHLKGLIVDSSSGQVCDWFEFANTFGFDKFCAAMAQCIGHEPVGDFQSAVAEVKSKYSAKDLLSL